MGFIAFEATRRFQYLVKALVLLGVSVSVPLSLKGA